MHLAGSAPDAELHVMRMSGSEDGAILGLNDPRARAAWSKPVGSASGGGHRSGIGSGCAPTPSEAAA